MRAPSGCARRDGSRLVSGDNLDTGFPGIGTPFSQLDFSDAEDARTLAPNGKTMKRTFEIIRIRNLMERFDNSETHRGRIRFKTHNLDQLIKFPAPDFGNSINDLTEQPLAGGISDAGQMLMLSPETFLVQNCTVWSKFGVITVDDYLIRESLFSFPHHMMPELKLSG